MNTNKNQEFAFGLVIHLLLQGQRPTESQLEACGSCKSVAQLILNSFDIAPEGKKEEKVRVIIDQFRTSNDAKKYADMLDAYVAQSTEETAVVVTSVPVSEPSRAPSEALPVLVEEPFNAGGSTIDAAENALPREVDLLAQETAQEEQPNEGPRAETELAPDVTEGEPFGDGMITQSASKEAPEILAAEQPQEEEGISPVQNEGSGITVEEPLSPGDGLPHPASVTSFALEEPQGVPLLRAEVEEVSIEVTGDALLDFSVEVKLPATPTVAERARTEPDVPEDDDEEEGGNRWPRPIPFPEPERPQALDPALLPGLIRRLATDISERMSSPLDFSAMTLLVALGAAIGRRIAIRPRQFGPWTVICNLWGVLIGRPGSKKSPSMRAALEPLRILENEEAEAFEVDSEQYEALKRWQDARKGEIDKRLKEATQEEAVAIHAQEQLDPPVCKRFITNDPTPEKLCELCIDNPNGVLVERDEIKGLLSTFNKPGQEGARHVYLEGWSGDSSRTSDRISRGTRRVKHLCLSLIGTIQPEVLKASLRDGITGGAEDDGLMQRLQLAVYPELGDYVLIDRPPDETILQNVVNLFRWLVALDPVRVGAEPGSDEKPPYLRFSESAQRVFNDWETNLLQRTRSGSYSPAFGAHLDKYVSLVPSLALIHHLAERKAGPVGIDSLKAAIGLADYLESHARRIYGQTEPRLLVAQLLAEKLLQDKLKDGFTRRDVRRNRWSGLREDREIERALVELVQRRWLRAVLDTSCPNPTTRYYINPAIMVR